MVGALHVNRTIDTYSPNPKQALAHADAAKFILMLGAWGSGKSFWLIWEDIVRAMEYPGSLGVVFRHTYPALRDTTKRDYLATVPMELVKNEIKSEGREEIEFINGSRTLFRCLDNFKKLGSTQFDRVAVDEAEEVDEQSFMTLAFGRLRGKIGPRRMTLATNPPDEDHFLYKFFVEEAAPDRAIYHLSTYDNAANLPPGYIANLEKMPKQWRRKYLDGKWGILQKGTGVFASTFDEDIHVDTLKPMLGRQVIRGWDFGWHRPACVWMQFDAQENVSILHELLGDKEPLRQFARRVQNETKRLFPDCPVEDYCDISGNQKNDRGPTACQILHNEFGIPTMSRKMGINQGIQGIHALLEQKRLKVNRSCKWIVKGFLGGYYIDPVKSEPAKDNLYDHLFDALRYALWPKILKARSDYEGRPLPYRRPSWDADPLVRH